MAFKYKQFQVVYIEDIKREIDNIYYYISENLLSKNAANNLIAKIENVIDNLEIMPKMYAKLNLNHISRINYRRIIINNYVIIYTINKKII